MTKNPEDMSEDEILKQLAEDIGFVRMPPTIREFVTDPYFLGDGLGKTLFPKWLPVLEEIYPNPISTNCFIFVPKGCIGSGKSTISIIMAMYDTYKLSLIEDKSRFLNLNNNSPFTVRLYNVNKDKAKDTIYSGLVNEMKNCPAFIERAKELGSKFSLDVKVQIGSRVNDALSEALLTVVLSEINFFPRRTAEGIMAEVIGRITSRFTQGISILPHVILDSSDTEDDSVVETFLKENPFPDLTYTVTWAYWEIRSHEQDWWEKGTAYIDLGDTTIPPSYHTVKPVGISEDRIIKVPKLYESEIKIDIHKFLRDKVGMSVKSTGLYINSDALDEVERIEVDYPDTILYGLSQNKGETLMSKLKPYIEKYIPVESKVFATLDLGINHDIAGIAIGYLESLDQEEILDAESSGTGRSRLVPVYSVPIAIGLDREAGDETPIEELGNFFVELDALREIAMFSSDTYQSKSINQRLKIEGVPCKMLSVDRTTEAYDTLKRAIMQKRISLPSNDLLFHELKYLRKVVNTSGGVKIDHDRERSKDISDAVASCVALINEDMQQAHASPVKYAGRKHTKNMGSTYSQMLANRQRNILRRR